MGANLDNDIAADLVLEPITADELIDDRALASVDQDEFRLQDFVADLAERCRVAPTPANIALYGAWGSGKSSLGNLLEVEFKSDRNVAFGRFDAFKFAEVPLRRHFLTSLAASFGVTDARFSTDLYESKKNQRFHLDARNLAQLAIALVAAALVLALIAVAVSAVVAAVGSGFKHFGTTFVSALRTSIPGVLVATPLFAALVAVAFRRFEVEVTSSAPSSDEEFERVFKDLVATIKQKTHRRRVVVFIDELDRCSPKQVGSVLETMRTFLDVDSCVFIVAADQQALETALSEGGARQATPVDPANPYYSSGNAYLDKIFNYQLALPPLMPRRLSRFALALVEGRPGVWERVPNQADLVSVLIPTHVRSPRRVKTLLNTFASDYRVAIRRAAADVLDANVEARAPEVAKLVCLRTEFPLFARHLTTDARLPEVVLELAEHPARTFEEIVAQRAGFSRDAFDRARSYATGELPVADLLSRRDTTADESDASSAEDSENEETNAEVQRTYTQQLIHYLQRTRSISGPSRDLIYLESSGAAFGLPAEFADALEVAAVDGSFETVGTAIQSLESDEHQLAAFRLLAQLVVEGAVGLEARNVARSLFTALGRATVDLASIADDVLSAVETYNRGYQLAGEDLPGALALSLSSNSSAALALRQEILNRDEAVDDRDLGIEFIENADRFDTTDVSRLSAVLAARMTDTKAEGIVEALAGVSEQRTVAVLRGIDVEAHGEPDSTGAAAATTAAADADGVGAPVAGDFRELAEALVDAGRTEIGLEALDKLLALKTDDSREEAEKIVGRFAPIADEARALEIVDAARQSPLPQWHLWLDALDPGVISGDNKESRDVVGRALGAVWRARFNPAATTPATHEESLPALASLSRPLAGFPIKFNLDSWMATPPKPVTTPAQGEVRSEQFATMWAVSDAGIVLPGTVAGQILDDLAGVLAASVPAANPNPLAPWLISHAIRALAVADQDAVEAFSEAVSGSGWLSETTRSALQLHVSAALRRSDPSVSSPLAPAEIAALAANDAVESKQAVAVWIERFDPTPQDVVSALGAEATAGTLSASIRKALGDLGDRWGEEAKADLLDHLASGYVEGTSDDLLLRDLGASGADPDRAAATLSSLFSDSSNNDRRRRVLHLWGVVQPSGVKAQRVLVDEMFLPLINGSKGGARIALDHIALVSHVGKPTQTKISNALFAAAAGDGDLVKRINKVLQRITWIKRPRKKIGPFRF